MPPESALDVRSSALTAGSVSRLAAWGVTVPSSALTPIQSINVSASGHWGGNQFVAAEHNVEAFGYVGENAKIQASLMQVVNAHPQIRLLENTTVDELEINAGSVQVSLGGTSETIDSELILISDGSQSPVAKQLGIAYEELDFNQHAIVCNVQLKQSHNNCARERFVDGKPLAMLPLGDNRYAVVWCLSPDDAQRHLELSDPAFCEALVSACSGRVDGVTSVGKRVCFPLVASRSQEIFRRRVAVIGNAAHTLHPVAGQGFNLCIRDIDHLATALSNVSSLGDIAALDEWSRSVAADQHQTWTACHSLVAAFEKSGPLSRSLRSALMYALGVTPTATETFLTRAADAQAVQL